MAYHLLTLESDRLCLLPSSVVGWLSEGRLAWFVLDAVEELDLAAFDAEHRADGGAAQRTIPPRW